ncbi:MAG: protein-glutamate O-methyltransferase CheR [Deltaproteobacteria bacterium]|nr:protein-glutamate O-methyltransferase CheR [Deltaproteobacteria bacterium]
MKPIEIEEIEIDLILDAMFKRHGYDFRDYARASLKRRLMHRVISENLSHISEMFPKIMRDEAFFKRLLLDLSITVTEMFRDAGFYQAFRETIVPKLRVFPFFKIWHAGCATGEEVYSMAILLHEEGLLKKAQIYATDFNSRALESAKEGLYAADNLALHEKNYSDAGGKTALKDYYRAMYQSFKIHDFLKEKITFADHNLATDGVFGEMHVILCRNVMIYFNQKLQTRVLTLFLNSLDHRGYLCLGKKESLFTTGVVDAFERVSREYSIYRKK